VDATLACNNDVCAQCGGAGQACCPTTGCANGGCCDQDNNTTCIAANAACPMNEGVCTGGGCQGGTCGKLGQACCGNNVGCTEALTDCRNNVCTACGGSGQACCPNDVCAMGACANNRCP
jgi:hypothetical protein